jgi:hypothetical protein
LSQPPASPIGPLCNLRRPDRTVRWTGKPQPGKTTNLFCARKALRDFIPTPTIRIPSREIEGSSIGLPSSVNPRRHECSSAVMGLSLDIRRRSVNEFSENLAEFPRIPVAAEPQGRQRRPNGIGRFHRPRLHSVAVPPAAGPGRPKREIGGPMPYVRTNGVNTYYEVYGEGMPMVMLHCNPFDHWVFL